MTWHKRREKRPNIVVLMTDDTGWNDFGAYTGGGVTLGHPTKDTPTLASTLIYFRFGPHHGWGG